MKRTVKALTLAATLLTAPLAFADEVTGPPNPYGEETPLELRASGNALAPAAEPATTGLWTKLGLCGMVVLAGAAFVMKKRQQKREPLRDQISVMARTSVGVRSEVLLIEVAGQRLLVGVTPSSMRTLAMLPLDPVLSEETPAEREAAVSLEPSFERLMAAARQSREREVSPKPSRLAFISNDDRDDDDDAERESEAANAPARSRNAGPRIAKPRATARQLNLHNDESEPAEGQVLALARLRKGVRR